MSALRREHPSLPPSKPDTPERLRAKALGPFERTHREMRPETHSALSTYEACARKYESRRATHPNSLTSELRALCRAAAHLLDVLRDEYALPPRLAADLARWVDGEFAGTPVDVEVANHALSELLASEVCAEVGVTHFSFDLHQSVSSQEG